MESITEAEIVLGQVERTWTSHDYRVALLMPLYLLDAHTGSWSEIIDPRHQFPNRGYVSWFRAPEEAVEGSTWIFQCDHFPSFDASDPRSDRYRINWERLPEHPRELLRLPATGADAVLRLLNQGLKLSFSPLRYVYIALDEHTWAGPVQLVRERGRWFLDSRSRELPVPTVAALPDRSLSDVYVDGRRRFLNYRLLPNTQIGEVDWADDALNLKRALEWARKQPEIAQPLDLTKKVIKQAVEALPTDGDDLLAQRLRRARSYIEELGKRADDTAAFEQELLALPRVAQRIETAAREGRAAAKAQAEAEATARAKAELEATREEHKRLTEALGGLRQALEAAERRVQEADRHARAAVDAELARRRQDLDALDAALVERRRQLESDLGSVDAAISERLAEVTRRPAEVLAQIAVFRAALGAQGAFSAPHSTAAPQLTPPYTALLSSEKRLEDQEQVVSAAKQAASAVGEAPSIGAALHSALVSGMVPLLAGLGALDILEGYASVAAGGRFLSVTVSPAALEPTDLLAKFDINSRRLVPHPSGLLDLLVFAGQPEQREKLFLAVLDGVNRAAVDAYLLPILACYRAAWDEHRQRALHLFHPSALAPADPYVAAARLVWPRNVLLAGTLVEGGATVPLPPALWSHAILINTGEGPTPTKLKERGTPPLTGTTSLKWASWRSLAITDLQSGLEALGEINADDLRIPTPIAHAFARAYASSSSWLRSADAQRLAVRGMLLPFALATGQTEALMEALELAEVRLGDADLAGVRQAVA